MTALRERRGRLRLVVAVLGAIGCHDAPQAHHAPLGPTPDSFDVAFATSRGTFVVRAVRSWAPIGVDRFYALAGDEFFDENRFYRVIPGFIVQFGANDDPKLNKQWEDRPIADDSTARRKNLRGTVAFAFLDPNSRTHQLFINLKDNSSLDTQGFAPIGRVTEGMAVVDSVYDGYGEKPDYHLIATLGNNYLARMFPKLDYIRTARIIER